MGELIVNGIKIAFIVGLVATFTTAIFTLVNALVSVTTTGVVGEVFAIMSNSLPFDLGAVMNVIIVSMSAILSFMVANKIWELVSNRVQL